MSAVVRHPVLLAAVAALITCLIGDYVRSGPIEPRFHDEFSYLLAGQTFASGRLSNPPHPLWKHFETFQELSQPTYASKYPPAQGLLLAAGILIGWPIGAVYGSAAVAAGMIAWALVPRFGPKWALLGGLIAATHPVAQHWAAGFWGGSLAMAAGAALYGAVDRWRVQPATRWTVVAVVASIVLLNTRPLEGVVLIAALLGSATLRRDRSRIPRPALMRSLAAASVGLATLLAWTGIYNHAVTGSALRFPYLEYERQYAITPPLLVAPDRVSERAYRNATMAAYYREWERPRYERERGRGLIRAVLSRARDAALAFVPAISEWSGGEFPSWFVGVRALIALPIASLLIFAWRDTDRRLIARDVVVILVGGVATLLAVWWFPHYAAAVVVVLLALHIAALRLLARHARWVVVLVCLGHALDATVMPMRLSNNALADSMPERTMLLTELESGADRWLVMIDAEPIMHGNIEWMFNGPDLIDGKVVLARTLGDDAELIAFARRQGRRIGTVTIRGGRFSWAEQFGN